MVHKDLQTRQLEALSTHHAAPCLEWSKQLSRQTQPYFIATPYPNLRQSNNAEPPRRHMTNIIFDSMPIGHVSPTPEEGQEADIRSYSPMLYEDFHPRCSIDIGKSTGHGNTFAPPTHQSEAVIDPNAYPGWGTGKRSDWPRAPKVSSLLKPIDRSVASPRPQLSPTRRSAENSPPPAAATHVPLTADDLFASKSKRKEKSKPKLFAVVGDTLVGGVIPREASTRANSRADDVPSFSDRASLDVSLPERHTPGLAFASATSLRSKKEKPSEQYQRMLRPSPSPTPSSSMFLSGVRSVSVASKGFAPARYNHRLTLRDLLGQTSCDVSRAQSVMEACFGRRSRSSLRQDALYTPPPDI